MRGFGHNEVNYPPTPPGGCIGHDPSTAITGPTFMSDESVLDHWVSSHPLLAEIS